MSIRRIIIDADACPRDALWAVTTIVRKRGLQLATVASHNHAIRVDGLNQDQYLHKTVDTGPQSADLAIGNMAAEGDLVVTQDWGLAALVLAKGARALSPRGMIFTPENIDGLLAVRHAAARARRAGTHRGGPSARSAEDEEAFAAALEQLLSDSDQR